MPCAHRITTNIGTIATYAVDLSYLDIPKMFGMGNHSSIGTRRQVD